MDIPPEKNLSNGFKMTNNLMITILLILNIFAFILGLLCGKLLLQNPQSNNEVKSFFKQQKTISNVEKNNISIDDTKYVVDIKTDGLEKKYDSLGDKKESTEQISSSINKLKNLKK